MCSLRENSRNTSLPYMQEAVTYNLFYQLKSKDKSSLYVELSFQKSFTSSAHIGHVLLFNSDPINIKKPLKKLCK